MTGGIFNHAPVNYNPDMRNMLKVLLEEAKLSRSTSMDIEKRILAGAPLPKPRTRSAPPTNNNLFGIKKNYYFMKRTARQIEETGAFQVIPYRSLQPSVDRAKEKEALQNKMAYGDKAGEPKKRIAAREKEILTKQKRIDELTNEIQERVQFLEDMKSLGHRARYEVTMKQEIAAKLLELRNVQKMKDEHFSNLL